MLGQKFKELPDDNGYKPHYLFWLSQLFHEVGNYVREKELLVYVLELQRGLGNMIKIAETLRALARASMFLDLNTEGIQQAKESLGIYEEPNSIPGQAELLSNLAELLHQDNQLDAAEEAVSKSINLVLGKGE